MELPKLEFWFDYGCCLWDEGGAVGDDLPISDELKRELKALDDEFWGYLDWSDPGGPPVWTIEETYAFFDRAEPVFKRLEEELHGKYTVINHLDDDRRCYCDPENWIDKRKCFTEIQVDNFLQEEKI